MRDAALLKMGSSRAVNLAAHGEPSPEEVAAAHAIGTAEATPSWTATSARRS